MQTLSLNMIVKNEADNLERCLKSTVDLVDEIIITDTGSNDQTIEIAKSFGAKIFFYKWNRHFGEARNFSLEQSSCTWHLILDADEYIVNESKKEITEFINGYPKVGLIKRIDKFKKEQTDQFSQVFISRLFPKGIFYTGRIHEQIHSDLSREKLNVEVHHDGYYHKNKSQRNIELLKLALHENGGKDPYYLFQIAKEYRLMKDYHKAQECFALCYGLIELAAPYRPGMIVDYLYNCINGSYFDRGLEIIEREHHCLNDYPDYHFVSGLFFMEAAMNNMKKFGRYFTFIEHSYLRCLELGETNQYDSVLGTGSFLASYNLGVFYETTGQISKAQIRYLNAAEHQYLPALNRLQKR